MSRRESRIIESALKAYSSHGCDRCHHRPRIGVAYVLAATRRAVCQQCVVAGEAYMGYATFTASHSDGQHSDRHWFEQNPGSEWRLREPFPGELEELAARARLMGAALGGDSGDMAAMADATGVVLFDEYQPGARIFTYQMAPGERLRLPYWPPVSGDSFRDWVERHMLPHAKARATHSLPVMKSLSPEAYETVTNAVALLASPSTAKAAVQQAREQGAAMAESRRAVKQ